MTNLRATAPGALHPGRLTDIFIALDGRNIMAALSSLDIAGLPHEALGILPCA